MVKRKFAQPSESLKILRTGLQIFTVSRCENKLQGNECITFPKERRTDLFLSVKAFQKKKVSIRELMQVLGLSSFTAIVESTAPLQYWASQRRQIAELANMLNFDLAMALTEEGRNELQSWMENVDKFTG